MLLIITLGASVWLATTWLTVDNTLSDDIMLLLKATLEISAKSTAIIYKNQSVRHLYNNCTKGHFHHTLKYNILI